MKFKALIALIFICNYLNGQLTDINDSDWFRSGNFLIKELTSTVNNDIKGTPYLKKNFEDGQIIFSNGNSYLAKMRLNIGNQKFEILNSENKVTEINLDNNTKVKLNNKTYSIHSIKISGVQTIVLLDECNIENRYKLYYYPKKNVEIPKKPNTPAPSSGFEKSEIKPKESIGHMSNGTVVISLKPSCKTGLPIYHINLTLFHAIKTHLI